MEHDDTSTLTVGPVDSLSGTGRGLPLVPALTIAWHPNAARIGTMSPLTELIERESVRLNRDEPLFFTPGSSVGRSVDHRGMSREAAVTFHSTGKTLEVRRASASGPEVELDGSLFTSTRRVTLQDLVRGLVITIARQFVFVLHAVHVPVTRSPSLGLVGGSDAVEEVRRLITKVADLPAPVLIRGESGTGKELVANAIHETGRRRAKPFVAVNMAVIRPERAAAELFGYERGSFTGATESHQGFFRAAHGGTLLLDEIGATPADVQPMLLRVLDDHKVQPLGASQPRQVDVRLVAATDARLEEAVAAGRFEAALFHRLNSALRISLPPLRERREDIGLLLVTFLRKHLEAIGEEHRLNEPPHKTPHWLSARAVAAACLSAWPGNVRALMGLAGDLAVHSSEGAAFNSHKFVTAYLKSEAAIAPPARSGEMTSDQILDALEKTAWNMSQAAKILGVDKSTLSRRLSRAPDLQRLAKTSLAELERQRDNLGGDLSALARELGLPEKLLARRLRSSST